MHTFTIALIGLSLTLAGCPLFKSTTPEERAFAQKMQENRPTVDGQWESPRGTRIDIRQKGDHNWRELHVQVASGSKYPSEREFVSAALVPPKGAGQSWAISFVVGGAISKRESAVLAGDATTFRLAGRTWKRLGSVGPVAQPPEVVAPPLPNPGVEQRGIRLTGATLSVINVGKRGGRTTCKYKCENTAGCVAFSVDSWAGTCELKKTATAAVAEKRWWSLIRKARVLKVPAPGNYGDKMRLRGGILRRVTIKSGGLSACVKRCETEAKCKAVSWRRSSGQCDLLRETGKPEESLAWSVWVKPPPPRDMSVPPETNTTSPLCAGHPPAYPGYALTNDGVWEKNRRGIQASGLIAGESGFSPRYVLGPNGLVPWTSVYYLRALPNGHVHIHTWYKADMVLKRRGEQVVVGPVDQHSEWRLEHLWEHVEPPSDGVWIVIRSATGGEFLSTAGEDVGLVGTPDEPTTHWRYDQMLLPGQRKQTAQPVPVMEPPPIALNPDTVDRLTDWALMEYVRQEHPACWKPGGSGECPSGQSTSCGLFCATSETQCVLEVTDMVVSVGELAANIGGLIFTGGSANLALVSAKTAIKSGSKLAAKTALRQAMKRGSRMITEKVKKRLGVRVLKFIKSKGKSEAFKKLAKDMARDLGKKVVVGLGKDGVQSAAQAAAQAYTERQQAKAEGKLMAAYEEAVMRRTAEKLALKAAAADDPDLLEIAAMIDPTGVSSVVNAFVKPMCEETPFPDVTF